MYKIKKKQTENQEQDMKIMRKSTLTKAVFSLAIAAFVFAGCAKSEPKTKDSEGGNLPSSGGKTLEMLVIVPDEIYKGGLKDSIGRHFMQPCAGISQPEPWFDVVQLNPGGFFNSDMLQKHRNIVVIDLEKGNPNRLSEAINGKAFPQAYFVFEADNRDSLFAMLAHYAEKIRNQFYKNEHKRVENAFKRIENTGITRRLKKKFGFHLTVSEDFYLAKDEPNLVWLRKEPKDASMNILIYTEPCSGKCRPSQEEIMEMRDKIAKEYVPGPAKGSYMGTEKRYPLTTKTVRIGQYDATETRGLWRLFGDWMGGSFINYCFFDGQNQRLVMIDCFLYSPRHPKRDQLMQFEGIVKALKTVE